ncbi:LysR family transcriptional regulator [Rubrivivax sp. A210]|uniref:LysR family transcriptional regulator n=1 Tax=Rubrivivax sp. A210 TaxID=2772301 RepID=UPI001F20DA00|nr:LysR family transcriptional regulator [Rubrivivax sp. A210]
MEQFIAKLDLNDLLVFAHVAELGSFSRAAEKAGLPKSTVSRRIAALEQLLGERLLLRTTRRQTLTEFGHLLLEHARQVVAEVEAVAALRERRQAAPSGQLRVSMPADIANLLLADSLAAFVAMYPAISLELDLSARRVDLLSEGFDVALRIGELPSDNLLVARRLNLLPAGLYASPDYIAEHGLPQTPQDLLQHQALCLRGRNGEPVPWVLSRGDLRWEDVPPSRVLANSPEILVRLARAGAGIAAVPDYCAAADVQRGALRRLLPDWALPAQLASAVYPGRKLMPPKARVFVDMLQTAFGGPQP